MAYHVYAEDGFESAHRSLDAAIRAAKRGAKRRGVEYQVVKTSVYGYTGAGHGDVVWSSRGESTRNNPQPWARVFG